MNPNTELKIYKMREGIAKGYSLASPEATEKHFAATPSVEQTLQDKIVETSIFLSLINVLLVDDKTGEKIFGSLSGSVTGRTNTALNDRSPKNVAQLDANGYSLSKTESDVGLPYETMDAWAKFKDFVTRFGNYVKVQIGTDMIKVGFNGTSIAVESDIVTNPDLSDVNKGWLQLTREEAPGQILDQGATANEIRVGVGGDYPNLDSLVHDVLQNIAAEYKDGGDLVAIIGSDFIAQDKAKLYSTQADTPTEKERLESSQVIATYGGLKSYTFPHFPARGLFITSFKNLSIYIQEGSRRRKLEDNSKRDQFEDYNSRNEGYVVEVYEKFAAIEHGNVKFKNPGTGLWTD